MVVAKIRHNYHSFSKINRNGVKLFENFVAMETKSNDSINTTSLTTSQDKYEPTKIHSKKKWHRKFKALLEFREKNGHCLVPNRYNEDPQLGSWVSTQRRQYKLMKLNNSPPMNAERVKLLESIGFVWSTRDPRHVPWEVRFQQLLEYKRENGDCLVPIGHKVNPKLSNWVSTQRQEYKLFLRGKSSRITKNRIQRLNDIGFVWEAHRGTKGRKQHKNNNMDTSQERRHQCLEHNNVVQNVISMEVTKNVLPSQPQAPVHLQRMFVHPSPYNFCSPQMDAPCNGNSNFHFTQKHHYTIPAQRNGNNYNKWMQKQQLNKSVLDRFYPISSRQAPQPNNPKLKRRFTQQHDTLAPPLVNLHIEPRASSISSCTKIDSYLENSDHLWNENLEKLRLFYKKNGHSLVPKRYPQDPDLGAWVFNLREEFRSKPSLISSPKYAALNKLQFAWTFKSNPAIPSKIESAIMVCEKEKPLNQGVQSDTHFSRQVSPSCNNDRHNIRNEDDNSNRIFMSLQNQTNKKIASSMQAAITLCSLCNPITPMKKTEENSDTSLGIKRYF